MNLNTNCIKYYIIIKYIKILAFESRIYCRYAIAVPLPLYSLNTHKFNPYI